MLAKPLRMALGSLLIQKQLGFSDRELVEELTENPYFQYFIGLPGYQTEPPFVPSLLVEFRKCLTDDILGEINEMIIAYNTPDDPTTGGGSNPDTTATDTVENNGTLILDATCAPQNISFPQDVNLLNEARENLEGIVDDICRRFDYYVPRMYRRNARKDYLNLAKCKKRTAKKIRKAIKKQLQYIVSAKYSCGFSNTLISSIIVGERYLNYFTTITEDRLWQLLAKPVFRWRNRSGLSMNAAKAV